MADSTAIGIDLGTTYCCVAVERNGSVEIIPDIDGSRITPSYVAFTKDERLIGEAAKSQAAFNAKNTIFDAKRLIGRSYDDPTIQFYIDRWPFNVLDDDGSPYVEVEYREETRSFIPEEISGMLLARLKENAESFLGHAVSNAVITVPANFNDAQREATKDAATIAGLNVLKLTNEPTAASIAYGISADPSLKNTEERKILVFDLGGGTFDVSIITIQGNNFEVKATTGDGNLGGEDFNNRMVEHFIEELIEQHGVDVREDIKARTRLRMCCERTKKALSFSQVADIDLASIKDKTDLTSQLTREQFEGMNADLFRGTIVTVERALEDAGLDKGDIDDVILVGGSTRIPKIQSLLREFFEGKELNHRINPDEAVAIGAAKEAFQLMKSKTDESVDPLFNLQDVTPVSLGINLLGDEMSFIVKRNTPIPTKYTREYQTLRDFQSEVEIAVYEGERIFTKDNNLLGCFTLNKLTYLPAGKAKILVTFAIDASGILNVSAVEKADMRNEKNITLQSHKGRLTQEEIDRIIREAEEFKEHDEKYRAGLLA